MSLPQYAAPLILEPGPSLRLAWTLALVHGATLLLAFLLPVHGGWRAALVLLIAVSAWRSIALHALRWSKSAVVHITWDSEDRWRVRRRDGEVLQATLLGDSLVLSYLVVLNFKPTMGRRFSVVLLGDCLPPQRFRQLRVRLRISSAAEDPSDQAQP